MPRFTTSSLRSTNPLHLFYSIGAEKICRMSAIKATIGSVMGFFDHEIHKRWLDANTCAFLDDVTHWMEKPEDPEKTQEGDPE